MSARATHTGFQHGADEEPLENEGNLCNFIVIHLSFGEGKKFKLFFSKLPSHVQ